MLRFVPDHVGGVGTKRKHGPKSCKMCKKRHKRCSHTVAPSESEASHSSSLILDQDVGSTVDTPIRELPSDTDTQPAHPQLQRQQQKQPTPPEINVPKPPAAQTSVLRFVGDLSPEASFLATQGRQDGQNQRTEVGIWLDSRPGDPSPLDSTDADNIAEPAIDPSLRLDGFLGLEAIHNHLSREYTSLLPPDYEFGQMSALYFAKFDPIFPILHDETLDNYDFADTLALKQSICLVAALDPSLQPHLRLPHTAVVLSQSDFRACIASALKHTLDAGLIRHRMVLLQVTALMAFYVDKPGASEVSSHYTAQTVELSQTLGLHLGWPSDVASSNKASRIFWCVWTLDRLNAATNGRPILIHQQDMDQRVLESVDKQASSFGLFVRISRLLDETISQYRPHHAIAGVQFSANEPHTFEGLIREVGATDVNAGVLASLEIFYLAVVILQSRPKAPSLSSNSQALSSNLQSFCAMSILSMVSGEFKSSMTFWAVLPYAVSLAASTAYRTLRNTTVQYKRKQAYTLFYRSCDALDDLSKSFLSAKAMARLTRNALEELKRVSMNTDESESQSDKQPPLDQAPELGGSPSKTISDVVSTVSPTVYWQPSALPSGGLENDPRGVIDGAEKGMHHLSICYGHGSENIGGIFDDLNPDSYLRRMDAALSTDLNPNTRFFPEQWMDGGPVDDEYT